MLSHSGDAAAFCGPAAAAPGALSAPMPFERKSALPFFSALTQPYILAVLGASAAGQGAAANGTLRCEPQAIDKAEMDSIAETIVNTKVERAKKSKDLQIRPLRGALQRSRGLPTEYAPASKEGLRANILRPDGWYKEMQIGLADVAHPFVLSYIRAKYGDRPHAYNPSEQVPCGCPRTPFATGPIDAVTAYLLDTDHEALVCPALRRWRHHLRTNIRGRAIEILHAAVPEESLLEYAGHNAAPSGLQLPVYRVNLTAVCNLALQETRIQKGCPCGPWHTREDVTAFSRQWHTHSLVPRPPAPVRLQQNTQ
jgi:hypothetical protein